MDGWKQEKEREVLVRESVHNRTWFTRTIVMSCIRNGKCLCYCDAQTEMPLSLWAQWKEKPKKVLSILSEAHDEFAKELDTLCDKYGYADYAFVGISMEDRAIRSWSSSTGADGINHNARHERLLGAIETMKFAFVRAVREDDE